MTVFLWLILGALIALIVATCYALTAGRDAAKLLPIGISLLAVFISVVSAFRAELLPLDLVVTGDLILSNSEAGGVDVSMSLGILNKGYGEDIVEWVGLRVTRADGREWNKRSVAELNLAELLEGVEVREGVWEYKIHGTNVEFFTAFAIHAKSAVNKAFVFFRIGDFTVGKHTFVVSLKLASKSSSQEVLTHDLLVDQKMVDSLSQAGVTIPILFGGP